MTTMWRHSILRLMDVANQPPCSCKQLIDFEAPIDCRRRLRHKNKYYAWVVFEGRTIERRKRRLRRFSSHCMDCTVAARHCRWSNFQFQLVCLSMASCRHRLRLQQLRLISVIKTVRRDWRKMQSARNATRFIRRHWRLLQHVIGLLTIWQWQTAATPMPHAARYVSARLLTTFITSVPLLTRVSMRKYAQRDIVSTPIYTSFYSTEKVVGIVSFFFTNWYGHHCLPT